MLSLPTLLLSSKAACTWGFSTISVCRGFLYYKCFWPFGFVLCTNTDKDTHSDCAKCIFQIAHSRNASDSLIKYCLTHCNLVCTSQYRPVILSENTPYKFHVNDYSFITLVHHHLEIYIRRNIP